MLCTTAIRNASQESFKTTTFNKTQQDLQRLSIVDHNAGVMLFCVQFKKKKKDETKQFMRKWNIKKNRFLLAHTGDVEFCW